MQTNQTYIICLSNLSIPKVLSMDFDNSNTKIITDQQSIYEFLIKLCSYSEVILIPWLPKHNKITMFFKPLLLSKYRKHLMSIMGNPKDCNIYFFYNSFGIQVSWWLSRIYKENKLYQSPDIDISMWKPRYNLLSLLYTIWLFICYHVWITPLWRGSYAPGMSKHFLRKNKISTINIPIKWELVTDIIQRNFNLQNKKYIILTGNNVDDNLISAEEFIEKNDILIKSLGIENVAIKVHPRFNYTYSLEKDCYCIPHYIPANVILPCFKVVIGYTTSALFEAANEGITAISTLYYFKPIKEERKTIFREYLDTNTMKLEHLHYFETIDEFRSLIANK